MSKDHISRRTVLSGAAAVVTASALSALSALLAPWWRNPRVPPKLQAYLDEVARRPKRPPTALEVWLEHEEGWIDEALSGRVTWRT